MTGKVQISKGDSSNSPLAPSAAPKSSPHSRDKTPKPGSIAKLEFPNLSTSSSSSSEDGNGNKKDKSNPKIKTKTKISTRMIIKEIFKLRGRSLRIREIGLSSRRTW